MVIKQNPGANPMKILNLEGTGNPARRCQLSFCLEIAQKTSKIKYGVNLCEKLESELIIVQRSVSTINLCKKNGQNNLG